jgi:glycosyltransferase involved in cell wall biosynthesis
VWFKLKFLFLESFFGGSHRDFALGLTHSSRHDIELVTLPAQYWRWRMRGAAMLFHEMAGNLVQYDGIIATDMMNLSDFMAMAGPDLPPVLVYFHENQLCYPANPEASNPGGGMEGHYGFINMTTALSADQVVFNSMFQMEGFLSGLDRLISTMPDLNPSWVGRTIRAKSEVIYPGCRFPAIASDISKQDGLAPLIVWNHRWEYDKQPDRFFQALEQIKERGIPFRLALLGEGVSRVPKAFLAARETFREEIVVFGYASSRKEYYEWLSQGDIVVSTAIQENFGISVVEAVRMGCIPLLPDRLAYPEVMPEEHHGRILYHGQEDLVDKLADLLLHCASHAGVARTLSQAMERYSWDRAIAQYDRKLDRLVADGRTARGQKFSKED